MLTAWLALLRLPPLPASLAGVQGARIIASGIAESSRVCGNTLSSGSPLFSGSPVRLSVYRNLTYLPRIDVLRCPSRLPAFFGCLELPCFCLRVLQLFAAARQRALVPRIVLNSFASPAQVNHPSRVSLIPGVRDPAGSTPYNPSLPLGMLANVPYCNGRYLIYSPCAWLEALALCSLETRLQRSGHTRAAASHIFPSQ